MRLFDRKPSFCSICNKKLTHKYKPKKEWNIKGKLCGDCHFEKSKEYYEGKVRQPCVICGTTQKITDMWEPRWQWDMEGLLCKVCFEKSEENDKKKDFCSICGAKMKFVRYNPKKEWNMKGQLCRRCWDKKKSELR